jgi:endonuclease YncB( thermonuclease family)
MFFKALIYSILFFFGAVAADSAVAKELTPLGGAIVREVVDGDTVVLDRRLKVTFDTGGKKSTESSDRVRLVGIWVPEPPLSQGRAGAKSKAALASLVLGKRVDLATGGRQLDRHGRILAHVYLAGGLWVQGEMLKRGMARVYSLADNRALAGEMLAAERTARGARRGIWALPYYRVRTAAEANKGMAGGMAGELGTFQLIEGRIKKAARVKGLVYLNFGDNWRTDFTVTIKARARKMFEKSGLDPMSLEGRRVRVRGWLKSWNGLMIDATHPEQIELLGGPDGSGLK